MQKLFYDEFNSPVGILKVFATDTALIAITWQQQFLDKQLLAATHSIHHPIVRTAQQQIEEYFDKKRSSFDLPIAYQGTAFQQKVWQALQQIGHGTTHSYAQIAHKIGNPKAVRAVGTAIGANPLPIVIPCHRVIGSNGGLCGFAGGLNTKKLLLQLESHGKKLL